jgi:8-oxo-dGTP pyrophosphatase MutT (NUDIX family)
MWILTPIGFFSIVRKPEDRYRGTLTVRARVRGDLEALRDRYLPTLEAIDDDPDRDYRFRATAPRGDVTAALAQLAEEIDYDDFKSTVASRQGDARAKVYGDVWWTLRDLQDDPDFDAPHEAADSHGGVVVSGGGKILLRAPSKAHGGYAWTFAKTAAEYHESPQETALRAVREKTGYAATIRIAIPGVFEGSGSVTRYFVMDAADPPAEGGWQTQDLRWVDFDTARDLIGQTRNAAGRARDLAVLDAARRAIAEIPYRAHARVQPADWPDLKVMPRQHAVLQTKLAYDASQMRRIKRGFLPTVMEQKWFLCFTGDRLKMHRSWTGNLIYDVGFEIWPNGMGIVTGIVVNRDPEQYSNTDDAFDLEMVEDIIRHHLLEPLDAPVMDALTLAAMAASKGNYLGDPAVVSGLVGAIFAAAVRVARNMAPRTELDAARGRLIAAFTTDDAGYTRMPGWHSAAQLGKAVRRYLADGPALARSRKLATILEAGLAALVDKVNELLGGFFADPRAEWHAHGLVQLNALHDYVTTVLLGTNTLAHEERSLADFRWIPAPEPGEPRKQKILEIGGEGGSIILVGVQTGDVWRMRLETSEAAWSDLLDADDQADTPALPWVTTWRAALEQLSRYPWASLHPLAVHPAFRTRIRDALRARQREGARIDWMTWDQLLTDEREHDGADMPSDHRDPE